MLIDTIKQEILETSHNAYFPSNASAYMMGLPRTSN
jgi:hypothetical protein